ncbi:MAG: hypothetical protein ABI743_03650 [bacterium]
MSSDRLHHRSLGAPIKMVGIAILIPVIVCLLVRIQMDLRMLNRNVREASSFHAFTAAWRGSSIDSSSWGEIVAGATNPERIQEEVWLWPTDESGRIQKPRVEQGEMLIDLSINGQPSGVRYGQPRHGKNLEAQELGLALLSPFRAYLHEHGSSTQRPEAYLHYAYVVLGEVGLRSLIANYGPINYFRSKSGDRLIVEYTWNGVRYWTAVGRKDFFAATLLHGDGEPTDWTGPASQAPGWAQLSDAEFWFEANYLLREQAD